MHTYKLGLDIGSTTAKMVLVDGDRPDQILFQRYGRHQADVKACLGTFLQALCEHMGDIEAEVHVTGSVGMGLAEKHRLPFVQEVVAATNYIRLNHPEVSTLIDIGGEDAKVVFFRDGRAADLRMNGNCAGGTGAFIDQMSILLGTGVDELNELALHARKVYPIASRCGVFCKTDIQNLIAKNICREDIAASIFHAVAVQTVVTLAHGCDILPPVLLCGGPLTFIPALRKAFADYLRLEDGRDLVLPDAGHLIPAWGTALDKEEGRVLTLSAFRTLLAEGETEAAGTYTSLAPIFTSSNDYQQWQERMNRYRVRRTSLRPGDREVTLGIDSGSTTTKIVVLDERECLLYSYYHDNEGNPILAVEKGLQALDTICREQGIRLRVKAGCSTGYGEDLIRAAFHLQGGVIETIAHYMAARHIHPEVSFILDIGGQDMKAIFIQEGGVINRIDINEACSSGCGSFISTFARSLGYDISRFAAEACRSKAPCDLGTRCTVFMNSRVKQVLREGAGVADIAAGLSYSVVKNCLYKVLQLKDTAELGEHIVVQGGTMRNDAIVRALEKLIGKQVFRSDCPELMGALGCALYAREMETEGEGVTLEELLACSRFTHKVLQCHGCSNQCAVTRYTFANGNHYYSGNRCEKVFASRGDAAPQGVNAYERKRALLFDRPVETYSPLCTLGIPRCLNMYEEYPFWHALFRACHIRTLLSDASTYPHYEQTAGLVMSDNICFPAKLAHSHIRNLAEQGADRIFMPFVVYEPMDKRQQNSYNCPIVAGYSQVVKNVQGGAVPIDSPSITFKDPSLLYVQCRNYLRGLGVDEALIRPAFEQAQAAQREFESELAGYNLRVAEEARKAGRLLILLAGRPYHADPLIQHKIADMIASMGVDVITDDLVRRMDISLEDVNFLPQWAFTNRILKAAKWAASQGDGVQYMQLTSFGCGPDAFLTDVVRDELKRGGKNLTLLKIDDVSNIGSVRLRVRSLIESLHISLKQAEKRTQLPSGSLPPYTRGDRRKKIIVPFFTPFLSPLIPPLMRVAGYDVENLPMSDEHSCDWGLKYSNNEVCYPATLIVGDIIKAFKEKRYDPDNTCVALTQTGGQCRASNYVSLIRKALAENGYQHTPVVAVTFESGITNRQPGFKINWLKMLPVAMAAILYGDCIAKFYYAAAAREREQGQAMRLKDWYLEAAKPLILKRKTDDLYAYLSLAAKEFDRICRPVDCPRVGIVGEIFLKFHPFAQKHVTDWLIGRGIEVVPPLLSDFFLQSFVNLKDNQQQHLQRKRIPDFLVNWIYRRVQRQVDRVNKVGAGFAYFMPFEDIGQKAEKASRIISLTSQFGEGWLIVGEMASLDEQGINHVVSLQPFGCIANHIVEKGIEKRVKTLYPDLNILSLDFDSSVSEVNILNRLLLFIDDLGKR